MTIGPIYGDGAASAAKSNRSEAAERPVRAADPVEPTRAADRGDQVEISGEGRLLSRLSEMADELGLDAGKLRTIQERLANGFYQRPETLDKVAVRLLASGELTDPSGEVER